MGLLESCKLKLIVQESTVQNNLKKYCQNPFKNLGLSSLKTPNKESVNEDVRRVRIVMWPMVGINS